MNQASGHPLQVVDFHQNYSIQSLLFLLALPLLGSDMNSEVQRWSDMSRFGHRMDANDGQSPLFLKAVALCQCSMLIRDIFLVWLWRLQLLFSSLPMAIGQIGLFGTGENRVSIAVCCSKELIWSYIRGILYMVGFSGNI